MQLQFQLVEDGHITAEQLVWAMGRSAERKPPIGQLAVECGFMGMGEVFDVLAEQLSDDRPFGELAIKMGHLTRGELAEVFLTQMDAGVSVVQLLVEAGMVGEAIVDRIKQENRGASMLSPA